MKTLITRIKRLALALCFVTPLVSWADAITAVNPVTGETETYTYKYVGTGDWTATDWQNAADPVANPDKAPQTPGSNVWDPLLIDGAYTLTAPTLEGWAIRLGLYNGAKVTVPTLNKIQAGTTMWFTVDATSKLTLSLPGTGHLGDNQNVNFYVAAPQGLVFNSNFATSQNDTDTFNYYLAGDGSVSFQGISAGTHKIKMADVTLSGSATPSVESKTLVSFTSTTKTFSADAAVKVKNGDNVLKTVYLTSVRTADDTTLTADDDVGACELVQTPTGIVLYYVDGDPADVNVEEKTYKPSININFTNGANNGLTTQADVGLSGYEVPGTSWNNYEVANSTFSTVNAVDSTGAASEMSGVSVTISGTRGSYSCGSLTPSINPLHGYIDENGNNPTPTVTVAGIPYYKYRVLVYHSTDSASVPFGYDTINGTNYTYVNDALSEGTTAWGNSGAKDSANAIAEGGNVLVTEALSGSTLTVVGHRAGGDSSARGCIAAIQIIEVKADVGENDLEIPVSGDTQYTVEETKELSGTVYLTGSGTLTLAGENKISAATIEISEGVTLVVNADRLDATIFTGAGTVVYDGSQPDTTKGFDNSAWTGTVWVKNVGDTSKGEATNAKVNTRLGSNTTDATSNELNKWGNANSFVKFTNVRGYMAAANVPWTLVLEDDDTNYAWYNNEGWTACSITIAGLKGNGTFWDINDGGCRPFLNFTDASQFSGSIKALGKQVFLNGAGTGNASDLQGGRIVVPADQVLTVASGKTWHTRNGLVVNGTLNVTGTLDSESTTAAVSGSGTVVFGGVPSPTGDAWWKNSDWNGTVQIGNITDMVGRTSGYTGTYLDFNSYGNANSLVKLGTLTGWMDNYTCNVPVNLAGTLTINNGISGEVFTFKKLISSGGYITATDQSATFSIRIEDGSEYAGYIGLNSKRVIFGTGTAPAFVKGQIYVSSDATITVPSVNTAYWAVGGIVVDGELKADNLNRFGGGTNITTGDDGVFTLTSTGNGAEGETDTDYARIKGTGSLKYDGTGWRALSTNNFPTAVTLVNEQVGDILLSRALTYTIGSLSGSKNFQGNYGSGSRYLNVIQSKDTEWSGKVVNDNSSRFAGLKLDASSTGTLTLSGTASQNVALEVNGGAVNLTGTWVGATTVAGTFGGTGTLTGNLTFSDGATFKAFAADDEDGLVVSGTVGYPAEGKVTVDVSAIEPEADVALIKAADLDANNFALADGTPEGYSLDVVDGVLTLKVPRVTITVPAIANATVTVSVGGETIGTEAGTYNVAPDAVVTATYAAAEGYEISGQTVYTIDVANSETTFDPAGTTEVKQYVASMTVNDVTTKYTTLQAAINAITIRGQRVYLLANEQSGATIPNGTYKFLIIPGEFEYGTVAFPAGDYVTSVTKTEVVVSVGASDKIPAYEYSCAPADIIVVAGGVRSLYVISDANMAVDAATAGGAGSTVKFVGGGSAYQQFMESAGFEYDSVEDIYTLAAEPVAAVYNGEVLINNYATLAEAVAAAEDGQTVTLLADATLPQPKYTLSKAITLNLNGKTLSAEGDTAKTATLFEVVGGKTLTVVGTTAGSTVYGRINVGNGSQEGNLTIQGGYYEVGAQTVVHVNGMRTNSSVSITDATIVSTADNGIQLNGAGTHTITDTSITGATAVYLKAGSLAISGTTTLAATGAKGAVTANNNGSDATGDALVIDNCTPPYQQITGVTIASTVTLTSANASAILVHARSGCTRQTKFVPAAVKANITEAVATEADVFDDYSSGIDPTDPTSTQEVTVDTSLTAEEQEAAAIEAATVTVPDGVSGVDAATYKTYFTYSATPTATAGTYTVAITGLADEVTETADGNALAALEAATAGGTLSAEVAVKPGLYYGTVAGTDVTTLKAPAGTLNTTGKLDLSGVTKPSTGEAFFIKIKVGATAFAAEE